MDTVLLILLIVILVLLVAFGVLMGVFANIFFEGTIHLRSKKRDKKKAKAKAKAKKAVDENKEEKKPDPVRDMINERRAEGERWVEGMKPEMVYIRSFDGLKLGAEFIPSKEKGSKKTLIAVHGYTANGHSDFGVSGQLFYEMGYNLLLVSQRAHRYSEGEYVTFGVHERRDCLGWINYIDERIGKDGVIFLSGISMGSTTVTMTLGFDELPKSVKGCIADCGLTSGGDMFWRVARDRLKNTPARIIPRGVVTRACSLPCRIFAHFGLDDYSTVDAVRKTKVPVLFIHGSEDDFVPRWMTEKNYKECVSEKELLIVEGAGHAVSYLHSPKICEKHIRDFVKKYE